ncbi:LPXTG cell wall anchor domain-containing protein [Streptomyces sp. SID11385]|uniref:prealbumin-like fold domain-containing protein n=1 Tax=Streptomyces sp. SID11385 TaxID=2706031 RepID=UPI0013C7CF33|nr:LPXTG cell wall anchor domain-containing protein [Streptomyces sp. SID11385]NEA41349.1 LPXTG cell wall anchor domain-containing protein [Streptomyces sp. SID11385]
MTRDVRERRLLRLWALWCGVLLVAVGGGVPAYGAQPRAAENPLSITYVARDCPQYSDIMANKARNNIQESLRDLGPNSNYGSSEAVSAAKEAAGTPLPPCEPLTGWTFSTGRNITGPTAATQNLSTVTGPIRQNITTSASTPELDAAGNPTGRTLQGAVTVPLNDAEVAAVNANALWTQGGTPAQPLNGKQEQYGFGALRCAQDALNGDNVERVSFPSGARHVFCYYYAVTPPPGAGTIKVVKHIEGAGQGDFRMNGNLSYADTNNDGVNDFVLSASTGKDASQTFVRGESDIDSNPWTFQEALEPGSGWELVGSPDCVARAADGGTGRSAIRTDSAGKVEIGLVEGETVTCTYTNSRSGGEGLLQKETLGGTGTFDIDLDVPPGAPPVEVNPVTTTRPGVPETVAGSQEVVTGTYTAIEHKPAPDGRGTWELTSAVCDGEEVPITDTGDTWRVAHEVTADENPHCLLTNTYTPAGAIAIEKVTRGGTGTFGYGVTPHPAVTGPADGTALYRGEATTEAEDAVTPAVREDGEPGPVANELRVDDRLRYTVQEYLPPATDAGRWVLESVDCGDAQVGPVRPGSSSVEVRLTPEDPRPTCRFTNRYEAAGTLDVIKTTSDDEKLRPDAAHLELNCADGTEAGIDIEPGASGGSLPQQTFTTATTCTVTEPSNGAAADADVETSASLMVDDGEQRPVNLGEPFEVRPGESTVFRVANAFTGPSPSPSPSPTPGPSDSPHPSPSPSSPGVLPHTGDDGSWLAPTAGIAFALLLGGGVLLRMAWVRRRRYQ